MKAVDDFATDGEIASWQRPPVPELQQMVDVLGTQMHEMISGKKTPEEAVKESQRHIDRVMQRPATIDLEPLGALRPPRRTSVWRRFSHRRPSTAAAIWRRRHEDLG